MVGLKDENLKETWDTVDINTKAKPNWAWFSVYQTLPHTELARYALEKKYLGEVDVAETDSSFHENSLILKNHSEGKKMLRLKNMANLIIKIPILKHPKFFGYFLNLFGLHPDLKPDKNFQQVRQIVVFVLRIAGYFYQ